MIIHDLVTPEMVMKVLGVSTSDNPIVNEGQAVYFKRIADELNDLIHQRCLYCGSNNPRCNCMRDE